MGIKLIVTAEKFDQAFSIDEWFNFGELTQAEIYNKMLQFVVDENDQPVTVEQARAMFKGVPKAEWGEYITSFITAVKDAYVNPTSGGS